MKRKFKQKQLPPCKLLDFFIWYLLVAIRKYHLFLIIVRTEREIPKLKLRFKHLFLEGRKIILDIV